MALAERDDVRFSPRISKRAGAAEAVFEEAKNDCGMIVIGEISRLGEELLFGNTAGVFWD